MLRDCAACVQEARRLAASNEKPLTRPSNALVLLSSKPQVPGPLQRISVEERSSSLASQPASRRPGVFRLQVAFFFALPARAPFSRPPFALAYRDSYQSTYPTLNLDEISPSHATTRTHWAGRPTLISSFGSSDKPPGSRSCLRAPSSPIDRQAVRILFFLHSNLNPTLPPSYSTFSLYTIPSMRFYRLQLA